MQEHHSTNNTLRSGASIESKRRFRSHAAGTGQVSFEMFSQWIFDIDHHWSALVVLPEGQLHAIRLYAAELAGLPSNDGPLASWQRLAVMLRLMQQTASNWGTPRKLRKAQAATKDRMLSNAEELEQEAKARRCLFRPA